VLARLPMSTTTMIPEAANACAIASVMTLGMNG
jgi:hypothetical protein